MIEHTTHLAAEVATQPAAWRNVRSRVNEARQVLPTAGQDVAIVGCGTSYFMAQSYAALRESLGQGRSDAHPASEFPHARHYDHVVVVSRSGTTSEVVDLLTALRARGTSTTAIVATPGTPVTRLSTHRLMLTEVDEQSVVQTRFATTTLALLRGALGQDLTAAITDAERVLAEEEDVALLKLAEAEQLTFLGSGWTIGLAHEAALKLRESAQFWTESYPAMEYRHGPISIASNRRAVWSLGEPPARLAEDVRATGAHFEHRDIDPMADLVRVHRLCLRKARAAGVDPDKPRHLARSVVLA